MQIRSELRADTNIDTCSYDQEYVQLRCEYVHFTCRIRFGIRTEIRTNIRAYMNIREYVPIRTPKIRTKIRATMA